MRTSVMVVGLAAVLAYSAWERPARACDGCHDDAGSTSSESTGPTTSATSSTPVSSGSETSGSETTAPTSGAASSNTAPASGSGDAGAATSAAPASNSATAAESTGVATSGALSTGGPGIPIIDDAGVQADAAAVDSADAGDGSGSTGGCSVASSHSDGVAGGLGAALMCAAVVLAGRKRRR